MEDKVTLTPEEVVRLLFWLLDGYNRHEDGQELPQAWWDVFPDAIHLLVLALVQTKGGPDPRMN